MANWKFNFYQASRRLRNRTTVTRSATRSWFRYINNALPEFTSQDRPLRLELFSNDQLKNHARILATKHQTHKGPGKDMLLQRLVDNEKVLFLSYESLNDAVRSKQQISPAGEWLLDNFHVIEEQIRTARRHLPQGYSRELPHLVHGNAVGYPRVYDIAIEIIAHVDGRVDKENIASFVAAYQQVTTLSLGEFWAIPIMLRLALIENLRRVACLVIVGMQDRKKANYWADLLLEVAEKEPKNLILVAADMARSKPPLSNSFVAELTRRLHGQGQALDIPLTWIEQQLLETGSTTQQTVQVEGRQQAANQVSVGASISSLRSLSAMNWREFVESLNSIDRELLTDPAKIYQEMDFTTRDSYRHVIEKIAKQTKRSEEDISRLAIAQAVATKGDGRHRHVGYFLIDKGLRQLRQIVQQGIIWPKSWQASGPFRLALYIGSIATISVAIASVILRQLDALRLDLSVMSVIGVLLLISASQVALALVNWLVVLLVKPALLPRLDFSRGIPAEHRTLVAIPSMLLSTTNVTSLLDSLEVHYLANRDRNLHFALLTDFADANTRSLATDAELVNLAKTGIIELNAKYASEGYEVFFLLHRARQWNRKEGVWMGPERKRGKIEALNYFLRNLANSPFAEVVGDFTAFSEVKYVITLDTDTRLPRDSALQLVGMMAHPLNRPYYDKKLGRVTEGYSIIQPRVAVSLPTSRNSWFVRLFCNEAGIDPYTRAVSDVYQDLFLEGSFVGKGIYDIDAFTTSLAGKLPDNLILSHDLIEGSYARSGLASDVLLYEDFPTNYSDDAMRRSRWIRGDWQILQWLLPFSPGLKDKSEPSQLSALSRWKIFDNQRRSLVPIATLLLLVGSWIVGPWLFDPSVLTGAILAMIFLPQLLTSLAQAARKLDEVTFATHFAGIFSTSARHLLQAFTTVIFLPSEALLSLNAITRSLWRMLVTKKDLLEWRSASDTSPGPTGIYRFYSQMAFAPLLALGLAFVFWYRNVGFFLAAPFLILWFISPAIAAWLSRHLPRREAKLSKEELNYLRQLSRKTWRFFETFVGPNDNWLPPDNFQEYPLAVLAHRTSPTNIGLALLANLSAYDFGYLSSAMLIDRTEKAFSAMGKLERFRGHFYNWYDTQTLAPLPPLYVSTVDSGNLVGLLLTLRGGFLELANARIIPAQTHLGLADTLIAWSSHVNADIKSILTELKTEVETLSQALYLHKLITEKIQLQNENPDSDDAKWWTKALADQSHSVLVDSQSFLTPLTSLSKPPDHLTVHSEIAAYLDRIEKIPTWNEVVKFAEQVLPLIETGLKASVNDDEIKWYKELRERANSSSLAAAEKCRVCAELAQQCDEMANIEYDFLYDKSRQLFSIGYNVSEHRRDSGFYDLLASEARLGSFVAIAQGHISQEHWFTLGRQLTTWHGETTLLSWSGSMFEYLMPLLVLPTFENTLLDQTYHTAVKRQIAYGKENGIPWGVSESGYNTTDVSLNYQYRAFGVPGLGFKRGLADDLVLAPYASVMAVMVLPKEAVTNMRRMSEGGFEGRYGFYEAVDYTPARLDAGKKQAIVRSFMAHHKGMSFLALAYHLLERKMQQRFQSDPLFKATELLLHERVPKAVKLYPNAPEVSDPQRCVTEKTPALRVLNSANTPRPDVHLLSNGRYTVMITNSGGGYSRWKDLALTRWREDPTCDNWGTFCYLRDVTSGDVWSATHQPSLKTTSHYQAIFPQARAEFRRRDHDLEMHTEITISPEDDIELRRFSITNLSSTRRVIEFTSYAEVVLAPQMVDEAHPAFSNLFVQTEIIPSRQAILCKRRPRFDADNTPTMFHLMTVHGAMIGEVSYETDRSRFIGRGRTVHDPKAMDAGKASKDRRSWDLTGQSGSVLDPIVAIRCRVALEPEQTARVHIVTGIGKQRIDAMALIEKYHDRHLADRVFELAWTHRQVVLRQLDVTEADAQIYGHLASSIIYTNPLRRASPDILLKNRRGQSGLWGYGISGDLPIILLRIKSNESSDLVRQMVQAHGYWRTMGLAVDLVIWNEDETSYRQNLNDGIMELIATGSYAHQVDRPGGIFVRRYDQMSDEDRNLLQTVACAIISDSAGSLSDQVSRRGRRDMPAIPFEPSRLSNPDTLTKPAEQLTEGCDLIFANGIGGFSADGREYVITTSAAQTTPAPWSNVIANPHFGTVVSESGSAYTWCENAHEYRLTPWANDALTDSTGEAHYLRDEETGDFWSLAPLPARALSPYETRHGFGYSVFTVEVGGIATSFTTFVAIDAPIKINIIKICNNSDAPRQLSLTGYAEWVLGERRTKSLLHLVSEIDATSGALFMRNPYHPEFGGRIGFFDVSQSQRAVTGNRSEFLGRNGRLASPAALFNATLSGKVGAALDSCSAMQTIISLAPGEERELVFVLGVARNVDDARTLIRRFGKPLAANNALEIVREHWQRLVSAVTIKTPDKSLDMLMNGWLTYQILSSRVWGRSGYYQSGGAYGFRDQLQDTMALIHAEPRLLRNHLLRSAARQYLEGDVQHWWHPPSGFGVRTHFSDDYLWLALATSRYVLMIGDTGILKERINFIEGRQVNLDEEAYSDLPLTSDESATLYEHCVRAISRALKFGRNGLPLIGCGDWNDGMNLVGEHGKGESVWLGFFLYTVLEDFSTIARLYGDNAFGEHCLSQAKILQSNIEINAWDGEWYRRAYFDNGEPLGSAQNNECQIDSIPQSWAVLSGAGRPERAKAGMEAVYQRLVDKESQLIKLFDPPFDKSQPNPGYIRGYVPGVRENGGQYTHAAIWSAMAFAKLGDQKRAWELLAMINPINHSDSAEKIDTYKVEPYVIAADVYGVAPHTGRGGWTWYTGSAGWMYRLILESLLGLRLDIDHLSFTPCVPYEWSEFEVRYRFRETFFDIIVRPTLAFGAKTQIVVDGAPAIGETILLVDDRAKHVVEVSCARNAPSSAIEENT